jgi:hypothetical protein
MSDAHVVIGLSAVIVAVTEEAPFVLVTREGDVTGFRSCGRPHA